MKVDFTWKECVEIQNRNIFHFLHIRDNVKVVRISKNKPNSNYLGMNTATINHPQIKKEGGLNPTSGLYYKQG